MFLGFLHQTFVYSNPHRLLILIIHTFTDCTLLLQHFSQSNNEIHAYYYCISEESLLEDKKYREFLCEYYRIPDTGQRLLLIQPGEHTAAISAQCHNMFIYWQFPQHIYLLTVATAQSLIYSCQITFVYSHLSQHICLLTVVTAHLSIHSCHNTFIDLQLSQHVYLFTVVSAHLSIHSCHKHDIWQSTFFYSQLSQHIYLFTFVTAHLCIHSCYKHDIWLKYIFLFTVVTAYFSFHRRHSPFICLKLSLQSW